MLRVVFMAFEGPLMVTGVMMIKNISLPFSAYHVLCINCMTVYPTFVNTTALVVL